jgi:sugar-specific transcriptional regulator TrmB
MDDAGVFDLLDLGEYEQSALAELIGLGRTTAPNLAQATGIPKARIYGVLDGLATRGFIKVIPSRPKEYLAKQPANILERARENRRQAAADFEAELTEASESFLAEFQATADGDAQQVTPAEELFHVVDVGDPSETETRRLYNQADREILVLTKSWEYLDSVTEELGAATERGVALRALFHDPTLLDGRERPIQQDRVRRLAAAHPTVEFRYSETVLPWRGTLVDPSMEYRSGEAIFLVEEPEIPNHMRQAALTENAAFVAGLARFFDLVWQFASSEPETVS